MLPQLKRPSAPMVMSTLALVVALGGTSYAASQIGTSDIQKDAVTSSKIKDGTIRKADIAAGVVTNGKDGKDGTDGVDGVDGAPGAPGADGEDGAPGAPGADGADGADGAPGAQGPAGVGRWALIETTTTGGVDTTTITAQSGGFSIVTAYPVLANTATPPADNSLRANGNVYINAGENLSGNGILASIMLQNTVDLNGDTITTGRATGPDANPEFSGEIAVSRCNFTGAAGIPTNCAPAGAQNNQSFVVSPRNSDGSFTTDGARKRFYVVITGDSSDFVPAP